MPCSLLNKLSAMSQYQSLASVLRPISNLVYELSEDDLRNLSQMTSTANRCQTNRLATSSSERYTNALVAALERLDHRVDTFLLIVPKFGLFCQGKRARVCFKWWGNSPASSGPWPTETPGSGAEHGTCSMLWS